MNSTLLDQFMKEECTAYVRGLLLTALDAAQSGGSPARQRFEFNRFEVTIDANENLVALEDVLDPEASGAQNIPLEEFAAAMRALC